MIVVGDAKTYMYDLQSIRFEYESHLKWLIPMPGDWDMLFNYQKALMKAYTDAGLVQLAGASGHRDSVPGSTHGNCKLQENSTTKGAVNIAVCLHISPGSDNTRSRAVLNFLPVSSQRDIITYRRDCTPQQLL